MAKDLHKFITEQTNIIGQIKRVIIKYKKLSKTSVTLPRIRAWLICRSLGKRLSCSMTGSLMLVVATAEDRKKLLQDEFSAAQDAYNDASNQFHDAISNFQKAEKSACDHGTDSTFCDKTKSSSLKLLRIALPRFSGTFSEWENFRHTFESLFE
jgi:hypothetical protein